jgi:hypothetical protein
MRKLSRCRRRVATGRPGSPTRWREAAVGYALVSPARSLSAAYFLRKAAGRARNVVETENAGGRWSVNDPSWRALALTGIVLYAVGTAGDIVLLHQKLRDSLVSHPVIVVMVLSTVALAVREEWVARRDGRSEPPTDPDESS